LIHLFCDNPLGGKFFQVVPNFVAHPAKQS
jgi:hypothetical protein